MVDPEKYADAALHERYLRPLAGHADVMFVVLNQVDRLPGEAADQVLDDLRRLLDEDGLALGEHGEAGAMVLAVSALTGEGVPELRAALGQFVAERAAAAGGCPRTWTRRPRGCVRSTSPRAATGLTDRAREEFAASLADAVGAAAAGQAAERAWARAADAGVRHPLAAAAAGSAAPVRAAAPSTRPPPGAVGVAGAVEEAVRAVAAEAVVGLPAPWAQAVREAARRGGRRAPAGAGRRGGAGGAGRAAAAAVVAGGRHGAVLLTLLATAALVCRDRDGVGRARLPWWLPPRCWRWERWAVRWSVSRLAARGSGAAVRAGRGAAACPRRRQTAGGRGCWIRWRRNCCVTGKCGSSTECSPETTSG